LCFSTWRGDKQQQQAKARSAATTSGAASTTTATQKIVIRMMFFVRTALSFSLIDTARLYQITDINF